MGKPQSVFRKIYPRAAISTSNLTGPAVDVSLAYEVRSQGRHPLSACEVFSLRWLLRILGCSVP